MMHNHGDALSDKKPRTNPTMGTTIRLLWFQSGSLSPNAFGFCATVCFPVVWVGLSVLILESSFMFSIGIFLLGFFYHP